MGRNSRVKNSIYNFASSLGGQFITIVMNFLVRTVFINTLGKSYLGIGSLFSNILSMLSLVELGVGSAILYKLYEPIADENHERIAVLMKFYKTAYTVIGIIIAIIGLFLLPFLPFLISDYNKLGTLGLNAEYVFCLYLFQSVSSYLFFAYKSALIKAYQKEYVVTVVGYVFTILAGIMQVVCLYVFNNFIIYVVITILQVVLQNLSCAYIADKKYPYAWKKTHDKISSQEVKGIAKDCSALMIYKMNNVVLKATDNIVLSIFLGLDMVALYSNYYIFYTTIKTFFSKTYNSISHSLGNLHAKNRADHAYDIFETIMLVSAILGGTAMNGIAVCADEFVNVWIGNDWIIDFPFAILMGVEIYTMAIRLALGKYRSSMGLFQQGKYRPLVGMIINLAVSISLVKTWGISGVLVGTIAADWLTYMWYDPLIIHRAGFKNKYPILSYYRKFIVNFLLACIVGLMDYFICNSLFINHGWASVVVHALICSILTPSILILFSLKSQEGKRLGELVRKMVHRR